MEFEFGKKVLDVLNKAEETNKDTIKKASELMADTIVNDKIIHIFGTGHSHMVAIEPFARAGGLANVNAMLDPDCLTNFGAQRSCAIERTTGLADIIYNSYKIDKNDLMIIASNSGRNAVPIEMAMRAKKEGLKLIAITNLYQSSHTTSRHPSGKRLFEFADIIIDTCVPVGDAMMNIDGIPTGPASSISALFLIDTIFTEAIKIAISKGKRPDVFISQNVDGVNNEDIFKKYESRCKHY